MIDWPTNRIHILAGASDSRDLVLIDGVEPHLRWRTFSETIHEVAVAVDAAMNDLARPALYDAWHDFAAVTPDGARMTANIAGPVCETGDTFAMAREVDRVAKGDLAVFRTAGAYGATMASTYNSRALVPEVLVDGDRYAVVADRIAAETILAAERVPEWL